MISYRAILYNGRNCRLDGRNGQFLPRRESHSPGVRVIADPLGWRSPNRHLYSLDANTSMSTAIMATESETIPTEIGHPWPIFYAAGTAITADARHATPGVSSRGRESGPRWSRIFIRVPSSGGIHPRRALPAPAGTYAGLTTRAFRSPPFPQYTTAKTLLRPDLITP